MPTLEHNGLVDIFRQSPPLAPRLVEQLLHLPLPPHQKVTVADTTLDQMAPVELRADLVLELRDANDKRVLSILVEAQRAVDAAKRFSWPSYVVALRSRNLGPVILLVVTSEQSVAQWASQPIDLGLGLSTVRPLVLGPSVVPEVTDPVAAEADPDLSLLSALAHGNGPHGLAVLAAAVRPLLRLAEPRSLVYFRILQTILRDPMKKALENLVMEQVHDDSWDNLPPFLQKFFDQGEAKGKAEGEAKGEARGEAKGEARGEAKGRLEAKREDLLRLLSRLGIVLDEADRERVAACTDTAILDRWLDNILGAKSAADVFR